MSQYDRKLENGRILRYGLSKATGGFFWQIFFTNEEIEEFESDSEIFSERDGLSLTGLIADSDSFGNMFDSVRELINDWFSEPYPTGLQINVGKMFNKDIRSMLAEVGFDVIKCLSEYT